MSDTRTDLPSPNAANFEQRVREALMVYMGRQGNPLDRGVTLRDLISSGVVQVREGYTLSSGASTPPLDPVATGDADAYEPDLTPPPRVTGFTATPAISHIFIEHDSPVYTQGHGHLRTRLYGAIWVSGPLPTFASAIELSQFTGTTYAFPANPATTWHLWVKWESADGELSTEPMTGVNGVVAVTGQDVGPLLEALVGEITESQLYAALSTRINLIDAADNVTGSVNARLLAEATARTAAILAESDARDSADQILQDQIALLGSAEGGDLVDLVNAIAQETADRILADLANSNAITLANGIISGTGSGLQSETSIRELANSALATAVGGTVVQVGDSIAAINVERSLRADGDSAYAGQTTTLASQLGDNIAALQVEQFTRADQDGAAAGQTTLLAAATATTAAGLLSEQLVRAGVDEAVAAQTTSLVAATGATTAALSIEQMARATSDSAQASQVLSLAAKVDTGDLVNAAALIVEQQVRADQNSALSSQTTTLSAATGENVAALVIEQQARTNAEEALSSQSTTLGASVGESLAGLVVEQLARATADNAISEQSLNLVASIPDSTAALSLEQSTRASADEAAAAQSLILVAALGENAASLQVEQLARVTSDEALSTQVTSLIADFGQNTASLFVEQYARATADAATAVQTTTLAGKVGENAASLVIEQLIRVTETEALATQTETLETAFGDNKSAILTEQQSRSTADSATASQVTAMAVAVADNSAGLVAEQSVRAGVDSAIAEQSLLLFAATGENSAALSVEQSARTNADSASSTQLTNLAAESGTTRAGLLIEQNARTTADSASSVQFTGLSATTGANVAALTVEQIARTTADGSTSSQVTSLAAATGDHSANLKVEQLARTAEDIAIAGQIATVNIAVGDNTIAIQQEVSTRETETGGLLGQYTVKVDANGYVSGFGLASTLNDAIPTSEFAVRADKFYVASPTGPGITPLVPFSVVTVPYTTPDGTVVPTGVYIKGGYIEGGTINGSAIVNGTITGTKLINVSANQITGAALLNTSYIESAGYVPGSAGWKIHGNGTAEFAAATIRGQLTASQINGEGLTIKVDGVTILGAGTGLPSSSFAGTLGGTNTVLNSGFAAGSATMGDLWASTANGSYSGLVHTRYTSGGPDNGYWHRIQATVGAGANDRVGIYQNNFPVPMWGGIAGGPMTVSAYFYSPGATVTWWIEAKDADGVIKTSFSLSSGLVDGSAWARRSKTFTVPAGTAQLFMYIWVAAHGGVLDLGIAKVQVEPGDLMTQWAPAPADKVGLDNKITNSNVSTYIAAAAITNLYIGDVIQSNTYAAGVSGWKIDKNGDAELNQATFRGTLAGASGSFYGTLAAGSSPAVSGSTMTGSGAIFNPGGNGSFAVGNSSKNLSFNGTTFTLNGDLVATGNIVNDAVTETDTGSGTGASVSLPITVPNGQVWKVVGIGFQNVIAGGSSTLTLMGVSMTCATIAADSTLPPPYDTSTYVQAGTVCAEATYNPGSHTITLTGAVNAYKVLTIFISKK